MREIEIKLKVEDLKALEEKLVANGLVLSKDIIQIDTIYSKVGDARHFNEAYEGCISLRIRKEEGSIAKITLKQQKSNEMDNLEYETKIEDPIIMDNILQLMGWKPEVEVEKIRKKGKFGNYEVCLDQVKDLGSFIELEKLTDDNANPDQVRKELFDTLRPFGLSEGDEEAKGYDTQIYNLKNK